MMTNMTLRAAVAILLLLATQVVHADIGANMVNYLKDWPGRRLGGGECAHLATEALRVGGGEFVRTYTGPDFPNAGDYVWGTLVKKIEYKSGTWSDSSPSAKVKPGDVIQYRDAKFVYSSYTSTASHHTSVVKTVNAAGTLPTSVFEQNIGGNRSCQVSTIDATKMKGGWIRIYRPIARGSNGGSDKYRFTIVNYCPTAQSIKVGTTSYTLGANNTESSYKSFYVTPGTKVYFFSDDPLNGWSIGQYENARCFYKEKTSSGGYTVGKKNP